MLYMLLLPPVAAGVLLRYSKQRLLTVQWVVFVCFALLCIAASFYGSMAPWCIHLRHVPDFDNLWKRYNRRGFYGVRDLFTYQCLMVMLALWSAAGMCGWQTSHITGVVERGAAPPGGRVPFLVAAIPAVALTFVALPVDSEDPFFEVPWGPRTCLVLLCYFIMPFFRPKKQKVKAS
eukprot:TRINITY_DN8394_c0_g1_i1.p1 TRINITY_DN8394_c0_g1~~TRINITY_DN8394_c0_g1_i1.p1  ORF type:complete len:208 (+),score=78.66 TRINITY_DN8394_c0_g1_i1:96-626(+)